MNTASYELLFGILFVLILLSGFFSGSETAMMSLNRYRLKHLAKNNHRGAKLASRLLERPDRLIGLILIGNNLVNILASSIATVIAMRMFGDAGIAIATLLLTLVILVFAEITPKTTAALYPERIAFPASHVLKLLMQLLYPAVWTVNAVTNGMLKLLRIDPTQVDNDQLSSDELRTIVGEAGPLIPKRHQNMLLNVLELEDVTVNDIMIPRNEVFGIDLDDSDEDILEKLKSSEHTRIPIFHQDINNVSHVLHLRNTSHFVSAEGLDRERMLEMAKEPYFVPENTSLHIQLLNFQKEKRRIGIVVDEYGVVLGVVTLEDILEEIVGEFTSSLSLTDEDIKRIDGRTSLIDGSVGIREINKFHNWNLPTEGPKTLNGLIMEHLESFPEGNIGFELSGYYIETQNMGDNLIEKAKVTRLGK